MRPAALFPALAMACVTGTAIDAPPVNEAPASTCTTELEVRFPDGATASIPCGDASVEAAFGSSADDPPAVRTLDMTFESEDAMCRLALSLEGVCGTGVYFVSPGVDATATLVGCAGTPEAFQDTLTAEGGRIVLTEILSPARAGDPSSDSLALTARGTVDLELARGARVTGSFDLTDLVALEEAAEVDCADRADDEPAPLRSGILSGDWVSGFDRYSFRYDMDRGGGLTPTGCPGCDHAGNLRLRPVEGDPVIDQSNEVVSWGVRTADATAWRRNDITDSWEPHGSGTVTDGAYTGTFRDNVGGVWVDLELTLSW